MTVPEGDAENRLTLWDARDEPPHTIGTVYRWVGHADTTRVHSLLNYAERHGERLRRKYLAWIHDLGESEADGARLVDQLAAPDGLSLWWMTLFTQKNAWSSSFINDAIRLLALEEILSDERPADVHLVSANRTLHEAVSDLCRALGIKYVWERRRPDSVRPTLKGLYRTLPHPIQGLAALTRHLAERWPLRRADTAGFFSGNDCVFFCSYFFHLDKDSCVAGRFYSRQWEALPGLLHENGFRTNWLQLYVQSAVVPDVTTAMHWARDFNPRSRDQGFHTFLDSYLSWRLVWRVLKRWVWLNWTVGRVRPVRTFSDPRTARAWLWPLMRNDWRRTLRGSIAMHNALWIELFDEALRRLPHQRKGLYLCENQAWERAFIHAWRKHGHGELTGVVHSTVRFWDLRCFVDPRTLRSPKPHGLPEPDRVVLNGQAAVDAYRSMAYPTDAVVQGEALRYAHLNDLRTVGLTRRMPRDTISVLILGDWQPSATVRLLQLLEAAVPHLSAGIHYTMKPHPNYPVKADDYSSLNLTVVTDPLGRILGDHDIAYSSNPTSAAVDAYVAGLPVVVLLDDTELNFSPLRGYPGVRFVGTAEELADALRGGDQRTDRDIGQTEFFFLDPALPRWRRLLGVAQIPRAHG